LRKRLLLVIAVSLILFSILFVYFAVEYSRKSESFPEKVPPLIDIEEELITPRDIKITQGMSFAVNVTVYSETDKELLIPFSLSASRYNWKPNPEPTSSWESYPEPTSSWESYPEPTSSCEPYLEATEFTYSYEPSSIVLKPGDVMSSVLTVQLFEDAPVGDYKFFIEPENSDVHHLAGTGFDIDVYPK
jgi:hypothetical protein